MIGEKCAALILEDYDVAQHLSCVTLNNGNFNASLRSPNQG